MNALTPVRGTPALFDAGAQHRRALNAKIHVAIRDMAMEEDDYRQLLLDVTGQISLQACSEAQMAMMVDAFRAKGWKPLAKAGKSPAAQHPAARKARALWISLWHLGVVHNRSEQALEAFAQRQLGCDKLVWARQGDAYRLIEALKAMANRYGWKQTSLTTMKPLSPIELQAGLCQAILARLKEFGVVPGDWGLDMAAWRLAGIDTGDTRHGYTAEHYARLAAALGRRLRDAPGFAAGDQS